MLDHGHGLTGQDGLINSQGGGQDRDNPDIGGDFVTDCNENKQGIYNTGRFNSENKQLSR